MKIKLKNKQQEKEFLFIDESRPSSSIKNVISDQKITKDQKSQERSISLEVSALVKPIAKKLGLDIWDICFSKEGQEWYLRIFVEKPEGVSIKDCETLSYAIEAPIDGLNLIQQNYHLEVSSPGLERELIKPEHFHQSMGSQIKICLTHPLENGKQEVKGALSSFDENDITLKQGKKFLKISKKDVACVKLDDFNL
ncbi:MAG: ribosome maturation factor RimP [Oscillospiraceae bacterium]|nr:ribosome maturation factor RimP [Oscillospiraceae bacterium]